MTIWIVVWVVLMMFWLFSGCWVGYKPGESPYILLSSTLIPWLCVLILGLVIFGAISPGRF